MNPEPLQRSALGPRGRGHLSGPRVVLAGFVIVILITGFVVLRIIQTSQPGPDPDTLPERPGRSAQG